MLKACAKCGVSQPRASYRTHGRRLATSPYCETCRSDADQQPAWSPDDVIRLRLAASGVRALWMRYMDFLTEEDRVLLRALVAALDRDDARTS